MTKLHWVVRRARDVVKDPDEAAESIKQLAKALEDWDATKA
jgi:hypothetical protein